MSKANLVSLFLTLSVFSTSAVGNTFDELDGLGNPVQAKITRMDDSLVGIRIYEVASDAEVGTSAIKKRSFYRIGDAITEDVEIYLVVGFLSEAVIEMKRTSYSKKWKFTQEEWLRLERASKVAGDPKASNLAHASVFTDFRFTPFRFEAAPAIYDEPKESKWLVGKQLVGRVEISIEKSKNYGNRFSAKILK